MLTQTAIRNVSRRRSATQPRRVSLPAPAGDIFGLETGTEHTSSAEAITDCKVIVIKRSTVMALAARDNDIARQM
jgi:CRP-like cAMP-binding protein